MKIPTHESGFSQIIIIIAVLFTVSIIGSAIFYSEKNSEETSITPQNATNTGQETAIQYSPAPSYYPNYPETSYENYKLTSTPPQTEDQNKESPTPLPSPSSQPDTNPSPTVTPKDCSNNPDPVLTKDFTDFSKIRKITAPGSPSSEGHKGHSFIWTEHELVPVYLPTDAILESGSYFKDSSESPAQYLLFFEVKSNCDFRLKFDHIDSPIESIRSHFPETPAIADSRTSEVAERIVFKAGDLIGYTQGTPQAGNWDFGLYDITQTKFLPDSYGMHSHSVCWVDYYSSSKLEIYRNLLEGPQLVCVF